ncbi:response regulator transcription factor [Pseudomonas dryadis]|uniref:response regulator transcription factor n=1 Tax=Phytopseudomonas dryadis TaxID=2487520 RepID=UPI001A95608A
MYKIPIAGDRPLFREASHSVIGTAPSIGTLGFITRSSPRARMTEAIRQIPNGSVYLPPDIIRTQKGSRPQRQPVEHPALRRALTPRQALLSAGDLVFAANLRH